MKNRISFNFSPKKSHNSISELRISDGNCFLMKKSGERKLRRVIRLEGVLKPWLPPMNHVISRRSLKEVTKQFSLQFIFHRAEIMNIRWHWIRIKFHRRRCVHKSAPPNWTKGPGERNNDWCCTYSEIHSESSLPALFGPEVKDEFTLRSITRIQFRIIYVICRRRIITGKRRHGYHVITVIDTFAITYNVVIVRNQSILNALVVIVNAQPVGLKHHIGASR